MQPAAADFSKITLQFRPRHSPLGASSSSGLTTNFTAPGTRLPARNEKVLDSFCCGKFGCRVFPLKESAS